VKVLHIEDCEPIFRLVQTFCQDSVEMESVTTLLAAKQRLEDGGIDVLLVDLNLDDSLGLDTVRELLRYGLPIVVLTGEGKYLQEALKMGVADYIVKANIAKINIVQKLKFAHEKSAKIRRMAGRKLSFGNIDALKPFISCPAFVGIRDPYSRVA
jgi:two-component system, sensor histidine kinase and response regulator